MDKIKNFFAKATSTQKNNIIFMAIEIVLVLAIAGGSITGVALMAKNTTTVKAMSSEAAVSSTVSEIVSEPVISDVQPVSSEVVSIGSEWTPDVESTASAEPTYTEYDEGKVVMKNTEPITTWDEDQFLPTLPEAASVLDYFVTSKLSNEELLMFTSLKGIVNKAQPRIYSCESEPSQSFDTWIDKLELKFNKVDNPYTLIDKYKNEIAGIVIYDDTNTSSLHTINLATTIAGLKSTLVVSPALAKVIQKKYHFKVVEDLRDHNFRDKWSIYEYMFENYTSATSDRVVCSLPPVGDDETGAIYGHMRDYAIAVGASVFYLDPKAYMDSELLHKFLIRMQPGKSVCMGWWIQENEGVLYAAKYGIATLATDYSQNLTVYAGMNKGQTITKQKTAKAPKLENKVYVSYIISDGDNLQYMEGFMLGMWGQSERGEVPVTWTMTPALADVEKPLLNYYNKTKTENDCFVDGPSAYGYIYPKYWANSTLPGVRDAFPDYLKLSDNYMKRLGWRVITVWNHDLGAMEENRYLKYYYQNMPSLLGITQQENMKRPYIVKDKDFLVTELDVSYGSEMYQLEDALKRKIDSFDGTKPVFVTLQAVCWQIGQYLSTPISLKKYAETQCSDVEFVRLDQMMQLITEYENSK